MSSDESVTSREPQDSGNRRPSLVQELEEAEVRDELVAELAADEKIARGTSAIAATAGAAALGAAAGPEAAAAAAAVVLISQWVLNKIKARRRGDG